MKGISTLMLVLTLFGWANGIAQIRTITGTLTSSETGEPLPGVNIVVKGTTIGTVTDENGYYSINAPVGSTLVFSFIGMKTREVLVAAENEVREKPKKAIAKPTSHRWDSPLARDSASSNPGIGILRDNTPSYKGSPLTNVETLRKIRKVGNHYILRHHQPYYRVAAFGAKYTTSFSADRAFGMPALQKEYSQGLTNDDRYVWAGPDTGTPFSWGPPIRNLDFDGSAYPFDQNGRLTQRGTGNGVQAKTYDPLSFFRTGWTLQNALTVTAPLSTASALISLERLDRNGIIPNSSYNHTNISVRLQRIMIAPRLELNPHFLHDQSSGALLNRGANIATIMGSILSTPPTFDNSNGMTIRQAARNAEAWLTPHGTMRSFAPAIVDNPFALVNSLPDRETMRRSMGFLNLNYRDKRNHFNINGNGTIDKQSNHITHGIPAEFAAYTEGRHTVRSDQQTYSSLALTPTLTWSNLNEFKAGLTWQLNHWHRNVMRTDSFNFAGGRDSPWDSPDSTVVSRVSRSRLDQELSFTGSYNNWNGMTLKAGTKLYFSNTLSPSAYTNFFPSMSLSLNLAELMYIPGFQKLEIFGSATHTPREAPLFYTDWSFASTGMEVSQYRRFFEQSEVTPGPGLRPETESKYEAGLYVSSTYHISLKATYFNNTTNDLLAPHAGDNGFHLTNVAKVNTQGSAVILEYFKPYIANQISINTSLTWSLYRTVVQEMKNGTNYVAVGGFRTIQRAISKGDPLGAIWGTSWLRDETGARIIGRDGFPLEDSSLKKIGDPNPDWTVSWASEARWRNLSLAFVIDIRKGGDVWNGTKAALDYLGMSAETAAQRNTTDYIFDGITAEGNRNNFPVVFYDPSMPVEANRWTRYGFDGVGEDYIEDASWIRLQDVTIGYVVPFSRRSTIKEIRFSVTGRNLILITPYSGVDPASSLFGYSGTTGLDLFNSPTTRSYNAQITLKI